MASRLNLQKRFEEIIGKDKVYFQPPSNRRLGYPCIIYSLSGVEVSYADDDIYTEERTYTVMLIHNDPDNELIDALIHFPKCKFSNHYEKDGLHHYVYTLHY